MTTNLILPLVCTVAAQHLEIQQGQVGGVVETIRYQYNLQLPVGVPTSSALPQPIVIVSANADLFEVGKRYTLHVSENGVPREESQN